MTRISVARRFPEASLCVSLVLAACSTSGPDQTAGAASVPRIEVELIAFDASWGNTEGPAVDSSGALYFTSRGTVRWTPEEGATRFASEASAAGPGGLWITADDAIFLTATDEREV